MSESVCVLVYVRLLKLIIINLSKFFLLMQLTCAAPPSTITATPPLIYLGSELDKCGKSCI